MVGPISQDDLKALPLEKLIERMDGILSGSVRERYGSNHPPIALVSTVIRARQIVVRSDQKKRKIARIVFDYLVELELNSVSSGFANKILFTPDYNEQASWLSPTFRLRHSAIQQYQIISSRIAMEIFMDLLHCIEEGGRLEKTSRSKFKPFRKWLCDPKNQFHYFAHVLLEAWRFDRGIRSPEVHGTSKIPKAILLLQHPTFEELNEPHRLLNALTNCWRPLIDILNGQKPSYMCVSEEQMKWFDTYINGTDIEIETQLDAMFAEIK